MNCRSCGQEIIWVKTEKGKRMPVDPEPVSNGNILLLHNLLGEIECCRYVRPNKNKRLHISHFVTCPQAKEWRKNETRN